MLGSFIKSVLIRFTYLVRKHGFAEIVQCTVSFAVKGWDLASCAGKNRFVQKFEVIKC